jgi:hypothetical protein
VDVLYSAPSVIGEVNCTAAAAKAYEFKHPTDSPTKLAGWSGFCREIVICSWSGPRNLLSGYGKEKMHGSEDPLGWAGFYG